MVPWLGLGAFTAQGPGSIPARGTRVPQAEWGGWGHRDAAAEGAPRAQSLSPGLQASLASGHGFCGQGAWMCHLVIKLYPETVVS